MTDTTNERLIISRTNNAGRMVRIGTLDFAESKRPTLNLEDSGPAAEELKKAWEEISKKEELIWKQARPDVIDGEKVTRIVGERVKPSDDIYVYAVMNTLERKYGFLVDLEAT